MSVLVAKNYASANPFVFLTVIARQLRYVALWRRIRASKSHRCQRALRRLSNATPGYITVLERPAASEAAFAGKSA